ncbi:6891_t:CDS:1, partial [Dentiscutata heterogama]
EAIHISAKGNVKEDKDVIRIEKNEKEIENEKGEHKTHNYYKALAKTESANETCPNSPWYQDGTESYKRNVPESYPKSAKDKSLDKRYGLGLYYQNEVEFRKNEQQPYKNEFRDRDCVNNDETIVNEEDKEKEEGIKILIEKEKIDRVCELWMKRVDKFQKTTSKVKEHTSMKPVKAEEDS